MQIREGSTYASGGTDGRRHPPRTEQDPMEAYAGRVSWCATPAQNTAMPTTLGELLPGPQINPLALPCPARHCKEAPNSPTSRRASRSPQPLSRGRAGARHTVTSPRFGRRGSLRQGWRRRGLPSQPRQRPQSSISLSGCNRIGASLLLSTHSLHTPDGAWDKAGQARSWGLRRGRS